MAQFIRRQVGKGLLEIGKFRENNQGRELRNLWPFRLHTEPQRGEDGHQRVLQRGGGDADEGRARDRTQAVERSSG